MKQTEQMKKAKQLKITQIRSGIGCPTKQKLVLKGLRLGKLNRCVIRPNTPEIWGMVNKISHMLQVEAIYQS